MSLKQEIGPFLLLVLKKLALSLLGIVVWFVGLYCWALIIYPMNLPYLLHMQADFIDEITASVFSLTFVSIVMVSVRTRWCFEEDLFFDRDDRRLWSLVRRIVTSREFIADECVCALWCVAPSAAAALRTGAPLFVFILCTIAIIIAVTTVYGVFDCILYVLARRRADRRLRKRKED